MKICILLVDDEVDFVEALSERLASRGFAVATALSGEDALDKVRAGGIDVVILDVQMPGMDGLATLHKIKEIDQLVEVLMLTGRATVHSAVEAMRGGAFDYMMKPADIKDLVEKITIAFKRKSEQEQRILNAEINHTLLAGFIGGDETRHGRPKLDAGGGTQSEFTYPAPLPGPSTSWNEIERKMIMDALIRAKGRRNTAAQILGWGRSTLWRKMKLHGLD